MTWHWACSGGSAAALHYATITPDGWALMEESCFTLGISMGGQPEVTRPEDCSILVELPAGLRSVKDAAVRAPQSDRGPDRLNR